MRAAMSQLYHKHTSTSKAASEAVSSTAEWLHRDLQGRRMRNPRYSLRRYSKAIGLSPSRLSEVLCGRGRLSYATACEIADRIESEGIGAIQFRNLIEVELSPDPHSRTLAKQRLEEMTCISQEHEISNQELSSVKQALPMIIFDALSLADAPHTANEQEKWLSAGLRKGRPEIYAAILKLEKFGLIALRDGVYTRLCDFYKTSNGLPSESLRKLHRELIEQSLRALEAFTVQERIVQSLIIPINSNNLTNMSKEISDFLRALHLKYSSASAGDGDAVLVFI